MLPYDPWSNGDSQKVEFLGPRGHAPPCPWSDHAAYLLMMVKQRKATSFGTLAITFPI